MNIETIKAGKAAADMMLKGIMIVDEEKYKRYSRWETMLNLIILVLVATGFYALGAHFGWG